MAQTQKIGISQVAAPQDNICDQNDKSSTPSHTLNPTITTSRPDPDSIIST